MIPKVTIVAHPETKAIFTPTKDEKWVKCQVASEEVVVNNGVISLQRRVAFPLIEARVAALFANLKSGDKFPMPGKIIRKTTVEPQYEGHKEVINPTTGEVKDYYQSYTFTTDMSAYDVDERVATPATTREYAEDAAKAELANG